MLISYETFAHVRDEIQCEEQGHIRVKGLAYPVATYGVVGLKTQSTPAATTVRADMPHLRLEIEPERMSTDERQQAAHALSRALKILVNGTKK